MFFSDELRAEFLPGLAEVIQLQLQFGAALLRLFLGGCDGIELLAQRGFEFRPIFRLAFERGGSLLELRVLLTQLLFEGLETLREISASLLLGA